MLALVGIPAVLLATFLTVLTVPYALSDDYTQLASADGFGEPLWDTYAHTGRPLAAALVEGAFSAIDTIAQLRFVRLVAVAGAVLLSWVFYWRLRQGGVRPGFAVVFSLLPILLPPFQVYTSWAVLYYAPWAAALAGIASFLAGSAARAPTAARGCALAAASAFLLLVATLAYQPAAMFFWVFLAIELFVPPQPSPGKSQRPVRICVVHVGVAAVALGIALGIFEALTAAYGVQNEARSSLPDDLLDKLAWFGQDVLFRATNFYVISGPHLWLSILVGALAVLGLVALWRRGSRKTGLALVVAGVLLVPLTYLPNLAVEESWEAYRTQGALEALLGLYAVLGTVSVIRGGRRAPTTWRANWRTPVLESSSVALIAISLVLLVGSLTAFRHVTLLIAQPQNLELRLLKSQLTSFAGTPVQHVTYVQAAVWQTPADLIVLDEFGRPSSSSSWVPEPAVFLLLREQGSLATELEVTILPYDTKAVGTQGVVVDTRLLERFR